MSFHWNLSSDSEDDNELEERTRFTEQSVKTFQLQPASAEGQSLATPSLLRRGPGIDDDEDEEKDDIEWMDGGSQHDTPLLAEHADDDGLPQKTALQPVTIDLDQSDDPTRTKRRRIARKRIRCESLPQSIQSLLRDLHRSSLLVMASRLLYLSNLCTTEDLLATAHSLLPNSWLESENPIPSIAQVRELVNWYHHRISHVYEIRRRNARANIIRGAPALRRRDRARKSNQSRQSNTPATQADDSCASPITLQRILQYCQFLSSSLDDDAQMFSDEGIGIVATEAIQTLLCLAMLRSLGWRTRLVINIDPIKQDLDVDHPLLSECVNIFHRMRRTARQETASLLDGKSLNDHQIPTRLWIEILCREGYSDEARKQRWVHADPIKALVDQPDQVEKSLGAHLADKKPRKYTKRPVAYVLAAEHQVDCADMPAPVRFRLTDVTPRYSESWVASLRQRGFIRNKRSLLDSSWKNSWWAQTLQIVNHANQLKDDQQCTFETTHRPVFSVKKEADRKLVSQQNENFADVSLEEDELEHSASQEAIPTSKAAFQTHPMYVLSSQLGKFEVLHPDAKSRMKGVFKGELIYLRADVSTALTAKKWLYQGRKVRASELSKPVKRVKARKKHVLKEFKPLKTYGVGYNNDGSEAQRALEIARAEMPLDDGMEDLYALWQTSSWSPPPVGPNDPLPVNEFRNIELALLNPGLVHIDAGNCASIAKRLQIPYAPCLVGFEGHGGNRTPTIRGIVVHAHNELLVREASIEVAHHAIVDELQERARTVKKRWKSLMHALLVKDRLEREYGAENDKE